MGVSITKNGRGRGRGSRRLNSEINVTPFVDVMLVLLVIFMVTSPMLVAGIEVDLPRTKSSPLTGNDEPLVLSIDKNGNFYIQETKVEGKQLQMKLKAIAGEKKRNAYICQGGSGDKLWKSYGIILSGKREWLHECIIGYGNIG